MEGDKIHYMKPWEAKYFTTVGSYKCGVDKYSYLGLLWLVPRRMKILEPVR